MAQTFCEKIPLHRQFANLLIQLGQLRIVGCGRVGCAALAFGKQRADPVDDRLLPRMDLAGMDAIAARQLRHRTVLPNCCQCHLRLEVNSVLFANIRHLYPLAIRPF
jgi:hypothetical protein